MALLILTSQVKEFSRWLYQKTNESDVPASQESTGLKILQLSLDIADAIIVLLENRLPGPALSLARPLFEGYIRGYWLLNVASSAEIKRFNSGECPSISNLLKAIGTDAESGAAWIHATKTANLASFHDLTHGGSEHAKRRATSAALEPNYPDHELERLVKFSAEVHMRVAAEVLALLGNEAALEELSVRAAAFRMQL
ncbi:MAG: DUF6988 family protein [Sinimarinibacterium flocculans]|uniref:DUF6988 family protein n=1 Tax=Sinimarinibacterium flocculans TaxID=985250 RepID=UPI003C408D2E